MSVRRQIIAALSEDSYGGIATLADVAHAEQLVDAHRAEVLAEAAEFVGNDDDCGCGGCDSCVPRALAAGLLDLADKREEATAAAAPATPQLTVYRASHDAIVMGLYTTAAEARKHCEAEERHSWAKFEKPSFDWIEDEEDGVAEMTAWVGGEECTTGYEVTALDVASAYDEEADE